MSRVHSRPHYFGVWSAIFLFIFYGFCYVILAGTNSLRLLNSIDISVQNFVLSHSSPFTYIVMSGVTELGSPVAIVCLQVILLSILILRREEAIAVFCTGALLTGELGALALKQFVSRPRPEVFGNLGFAFPSAHALVSVIFYGFAAYLLFRSSARKPLKVMGACLAAFLIFLIGYSRLVLNVHWMSDIIGGWLLGGAILCLLVGITHRTDEWHKKHWHPDRPLVLAAIISACFVLGFLIAYDFVAYAEMFRSILVVV